MPQTLPNNESGDSDRFEHVIQELSRTYYEGDTLDDVLEDMLADVAAWCKVRRVDLQAALRKANIYPKVP